MSIFPIQIKRGHSTNQFFQINWMLHNQCTYACSYCPPGCHNGDTNWLKIDKALEACTRMENLVRDIDPCLKMQVLFSGGEPTVWKDFSLLAESLYHKQWSMHMVTNLARSLSWWKSLKVRWNYLGASLHAEFANENEFIEKCQYLESHADIISVRAMLHPNPNLFDKVLRIGERIIAECPSVKMQWIPVLYKFGGFSVSLTPYTEEQQIRIKQLVARPINILTDSPKIIVWNNGGEQGLNANLIINQGYSFYNWKCNAGLDGVFIHHEGTIWRGTCLEGGPIGNILDGNFQLPTCSVTCKKHSCTCVTDMLYSKIKSGASG